MPSLKPNRLRGGGLRRARSTRSGRSRAATSGRSPRPKPIRARLRIACTATCGSLAQAWTQRSPPEIAGSRASPGNVRQVGQRGRARGRRGRTGPARRRPEQRRAEAEGEGEPRRRQAERLAGVVRRRLGHAADRADRARRPGPAVIRAAAAVHSCSSATSSAAVVGDDVEGDEVQPVLGRGGDAGLVLAVERHRAGGRGRSPARGPRPSRGRSRAAAPRRRAGDPGRAGAGAARAARRRGRPCCRSSTRSS